jgi:hypothetical protein
MTLGQAAKSLQSGWVSLGRDYDEIRAWVGTAPWECTRVDERWWGYISTIQ